MIKELVQSKGCSPTFMHFTDNFEIFLSADDIEMLMLKQFYSKALKYGFTCALVGLLIAHISFLNYDFSKKIGKKLLTGINKCNGDDIRPYLDALEPYLFLNDEY